MKKRTIALIGLAMCSNATWAACNNYMVNSTPDTDFEVHQNGTVTHKTTGLMWKTCSEGYEYKADSCAEITGDPKDFTWAAALNHVSDLNNIGFAGYHDWRLPNIRELFSILKEGCTYPAINETIFPNTPPFPYWSSSTQAFDYNNVWLVHFGHGFQYGNNKTLPFRVRLVRTP